MITTVIPTYNRAGMLRRAIESALAQDISEHQIHVHDNDSSDDTAEIVKELMSRDSRVRYFKNTSNIGAINNIIKGIENVTTRYYSLLSDDDFLLPGFYQDAIEAIRIFGDVPLICSKTLLVDILTGKVQYRNQEWSPGLYEPSVEVSYKMRNSHFVTTSVIFRADVRTVLGPFDASGSDTLYMTIAAAVMPFVVLDRYGGVVVWHESSYSIVDDGPAKESFAEISKSFSRTIRMVSNLTISDDVRTFLLLKVMEYYHTIFDNQRLSGTVLDKPVPSIDILMMLPSMITNRGLLVKFFGVLPSILKPMLRLLYKRINLRRRSLLRNSALDGWLPIAEENLVLLKDLEPDVSKLNFVASTR